VSFHAIRLLLSAFSHNKNVVPLQREFLIERSKGFTFGRKSRATHLSAQSMQGSTGGQIPRLANYIFSDDLLSIKGLTPRHRLGSTRLIFSLRVIMPAVNADRFQ